jgi:hypothetical protein
MPAAILVIPAKAGTQQQKGRSLLESAARLAILHCAYRVPNQRDDVNSYFPYRLSLIVRCSSLWFPLGSASRRHYANGSARPKAATAADIRAVRQSNGDTRRFKAHGIFVAATESNIVRRTR